MPNVAVKNQRCYNPIMDKITLKNYRCFRGEQTARLAPLTFLVGENSTGKTSFLALIRALWDVAFMEEVPDFREAPFDLGSFQDISHNRGDRGGQADKFEAGFEDLPGHWVEAITFSATFEERSDNPFPSIRFFSQEEYWIESHDLGNGKYRVQQGKTSGVDNSVIDVDLPYFRDENRLAPIDLIARLASADSTLSPHGYQPSWVGRPFASAPVRSRPLRTYDPVRLWSDPDGRNVPTFLANIYHRDPDAWQILKSRLEDFGHSSGLFDEILIKSFGRTAGTPFQVQIRKYSGKGRKGPRRNLIDVGYGVSQALPLLSELLHGESSGIFLLQQPEVHLHPSAQAALGSLFCAIAGPECQLVVETHSDYILDRVRMDIRDKTTSLTHEDVSILYFEPGDLDVKIHSIRLDEYGNVLDAPIGYRKFFMEETSRSIGVGL